MLNHRRTSQGAPRLWQNHYFRAKANFFGHKAAAKNEKKIGIYYTKKTEFVLSSEI